MKQKVVRLGRGENGDVYASIKWDGRRLSICGVEGPRRDGNCRGSCGQIYPLAILKEAPGWTQASIAQFWATWERWHLNDMRAECEHQRQRGETWQSHPEAVCPDCSYRLGSRWLTEEVPSSVIDFLMSLPDADKQPAWV